MLGVFAPVVPNAMLISAVRSRSLEQLALCD